MTTSDTTDPAGAPSGEAQPPSSPPPPPSGVVRSPRAFGIGALLAVIVASSALSSTVAVIVTRASLSSEAQPAPTHADEKGALYTCPMHPTIVQDHPGTCPICGMKLVPFDKPPKGASQSTAASSPSERKIIGYRSPMDPRQTSPVPRKDEMGMDYLPVYEEAAQPSDAAPCLLYTSPSPRDRTRSRMPSSA